MPKRSYISIGVFSSYIKQHFTIKAKKIFRDTSY